MATSTGRGPEETWAETRAILAGPGDLSRLLIQYGRERAVEARNLLTQVELDEFATRLEGPEGCDFTPEGEWQCEGGNDLSRAYRVLELMGIEKERARVFLGCCTALGGHCSCEILFNAMERIEER